MSAFTLRLLISAAALVQSTGLGWGPPPKLKSVSHQLIGSNSFDQSQVPWNEINAAWGQAALLLFTLAKQCAFHFTTYVQESFGVATSYITLFGADTTSCPREASRTCFDNQTNTIVNCQCYSVLSAIIRLNCIFSRV